MNTICRWALIANPARTVDARVFLRKLVALYGARSQLDTASYYSSPGLGLGFSRARFCAFLLVLLLVIEIAH